MGLLDDQTQESYYTGTSFGGYQFVSMDNIINNFYFSYVGEDKIIPSISKQSIQFHALRALQELSYDTFKSIKSQEIVLPPSLQMLLPQDYVNYTSLTFLSKDGLERTIFPTRKTSNPLDVTQDTAGDYTYSGNALVTDNDSETWGKHKATNYSDPDVTNYVDGNSVYPTYYIDNNTGKIHFSSNMTGKTITLKYISDSLGTDAEMIVHKFAEEAMYKSIASAILSTRSNVPEYIVARFKREKFSATRTAKLRLSNLKVNELIDAIRGKGKHLKG
tara:strand:+ start:335 stop:1159 length:825 start_codon:yes stop_codon:yes gene_type:complete